MFTKTDINIELLKLGFRDACASIARDGYGFAIAAVTIRNGKKLDLYWSGYRNGMEHMQRKGLA